MTDYRIDPSFPASKQQAIAPAKEQQYFSLEEIVAGDCSGTTDTDKDTDTRYGAGSGYTTIYRKY